MNALSTSIALFLHVLSVVIWVGGMFLAYMAVRPAAVETLDPPLRLKLWNGIFLRFFPWVWAAVILVVGSGFMMIGMMPRVPLYVLVMMGLGIIMSGIFIYIYFVPFAQLKRAVAGEDWKAGGAALGAIRMLVGTNLLLGIITIAVAILGRAL